MFKWRIVIHTTINQVNNSRAYNLAWPNKQGVRQKGSQGSS